MADLTYRLVNRNLEKPLRRLPASIELAKDATVEDAKKAIARQSGVGDFNRIGLFDPSTAKTLKDRLAMLSEQGNVVSLGALQVKDLGPQLAWRTVFLVEYAGPILFHVLVPLLRPYLYVVGPSGWRYKNETQTPMTTVQWLLLGLILVHFVKRELETAFVHRFSANTMPARKILQNSAFYWVTAGLVGALDIYAPWSHAARDRLTGLDCVGLVLFVSGEVCNAVVHLHLAGLRRPGTTDKGIPNCIGSSLVTCPNYMFEVVAWVGVILISWSLPLVVFISIGTLFMADWARAKEAALRLEFGHRYQKKRYGVLPGLL